MAYEYAIEERIYENNGPEAEAWVQQSFTAVYHPVTKEVAEADPAGRWRITNFVGTDMTGWQGFVDYFPESDYGKGKPLADAAGQLLAAHDFAMSTFGSYKTLRLVEVVRFTPKKVVIRRGNSESTVFPDDLIKVDKSLFV